MKMKALMALGLCLACTCPVMAQENALKDSIYLAPFEGCKIVLIGKSIKEVATENNFEVLKNKFVQDYQESAKDKDFPAGAKNILYLAGQDGRRRIKAIPDDTAPLSVESEINLFIRNLPPYHYTIYDLAKNFEYHIYLTTPEDLDRLEKTDITRLTDAVKAKADGFDVMRKYTTVETKVADTGTTVRFLPSKKKDFLQIVPAFGISLINGTLSPMAAVEAYVHQINKYGRPVYKAGFSLSTNIIADYQNKTFSNFQTVTGLTGQFLTNISRNVSPKEQWFGFCAGYIFTPKPQDDVREGSLYKSWKYGFKGQIGSFSLEFDYITNRVKNPFRMLTLGFYF